MNIETRNQYMETLRERYFKASKKEKGEILNEYCHNTGQERKYSKAKTPYRRLIESDQISTEEKKKLTAIYKLLNPAECFLVL